MCIQHDKRISQWIETYLLNAQAWNCINKKTRYGITLQIRK